MNSAKANSISFAKFAYKSLVDPFSPVNDGTFRPLKVILKNGTIFDPISPAPVALWIETAQGLIDLLFKVLSTAAPDKVRGSTFGSDVVNFIYGTDPRNKRFYVIVDTLQGGWGGNPNSDGATLYATSEGNSTYPMTEMLEANYPLLVHRWELIQDSCGAGKFRGGLGVRRDYEMLSSAHITACYDRHVYSPPWGVLGGGDASTNYLVINSKRGTSEEHTKITDYPLDRGDVISFRTGGGGGYGNPLERNPDDVLRDVLLGYISEAKARHDYGLVIDKNGTIVQEETRQLRESMRKNRS
jgi:N-methylhydantoinase B